MSKDHEPLDAELPPDLTALTVAAIHGLTSQKPDDQHVLVHQHGASLGEAAAAIGIAAYEKLKAHITK